MESNGRWLVAAFGTLLARSGRLGDRVVNVDDKGSKVLMIADVGWYRQLHRARKIRLRDADATQRLIWIRAGGPNAP